MATRNASRKKCVARGHEVGEARGDDVDANRDEDAALGADAGAERAEQERERDADELHHHERGDLRVLVDADLRAVDARHPNHRLDAVLVEQHRDEQQEGVSIAPDLAERPRQPAEGSADRRAAARRPPRPAAPGPSGTAGSRRRAHHIATATNDARVARRRVGEPERLRLQDPREVDQEQHAAAEVAHRVAGRRHAIGFVAAWRRAAAASRRTPSSPTRRCCR